MSANRMQRASAWLTVAIVGLAGIGAVAKPVPQRPLAARDSFRIGDAGALCTAQYTPLDQGTASMFDRAYAIVCRDAATRVGRLVAVRTAAPDAEAQFVKRQTDLDCLAPVAAVVDGLSAVTLAECKQRADGLPYRMYFHRSRDVLFVADGLRGYNSALTLGLRSLVTNRPVVGRVDVAITDAGDPAAFARIQAGVLNPQTAASEGYNRNNAGSYAEAAEFFERLLQDQRTASSGGSATENLLNYALQQSNLGNFPVAELYFEQAEEQGAGSDLVLSRLLRNYRAIDRLNHADPPGAIAALDAPVSVLSAGKDELAEGRITAELADRINRSAAGNRRIGAGSAGLTPAERARVLEGQAGLLRGTALRRMKRYPEALAALTSARATLLGVRDGNIPSTAFLRSEALAQSALIEEARGDRVGAVRDLSQAWQLTELAYPGSAVAITSKARLASLLLRTGEEERAIGLFGQVVTDAPSVPGGVASLTLMLRPYMSALAARVDRDPAAVAALFAANQLSLRPGLSQTQAVLARELAGGSDEASQLFRESLNRTREVARASADVAELSAANPAEGSPEAGVLASARTKLADVEREQVALQSRLAAYPRYRVLNAATVTLSDLQKTLRLGEGYYELRIVGPDVYAVLATPDQATAFKLALTTRALDAKVAALRATIARDEKGRTVTEPYDLVLARELYVALFGPVDGTVRSLRHLIWEADGGMLTLPPNLLVSDDASVARYQTRMRDRNADPFDFTGVAWLGRKTDVSTAVSPRGFIDVRATAPSRATQAYLGLGSNAVPPPTAFATATGDPCVWPATAWNHPISAVELEAARGVFGPGQSTLMTGADFSDTAIVARSDLTRYRILHFATHGLITAPKPGCPARPALLTSFGPGSSDGLLTFREIYDLRIDADLVILSACDTAGGATIGATREAGVATGGNFALDGLVRAFVGAGARTVVASHWPIPDDYNATTRLILGTIQVSPGHPLATALREAEVKLMDDPNTSHPFYWAAFAVIGDGERSATDKPAT